MGRELLAPRRAEQGGGRECASSLVMMGITECLISDVIPETQMQQRCGDDAKGGRCRES